MYKVIPEELKDALKQGRMLIISTSTAVRQSKVTAMARNKYICEIADNILFIGVSPNSSLYPLTEEYKQKITKWHSGNAELYFIRYFYK